EPLHSRCTGSAGSARPRGQTPGRGGTPKSLLWSIYLFLLWHKTMRPSRNQLQKKGVLCMSSHRTDFHSIAQRHGVDWADVLEWTQVRGGNGRWWMGRLGDFLE